MPLNIREIRTLRYKSAQFVTISLYFLGKNQAEQQVYALIKSELHLVDALQANILIENDILSLEGFAIDISKNRTFIRSCGVLIAINTRQRGQFFRKKLFASNKNVISLCSKSMILLVPVFLLDNCNFLFYLITQANLTLYMYIVDYITTKILVSNTSDCPLHILQHQNLGHIIDICYKNCFSADVQAIFDSIAFLPKAQLFLDLYTRISLVSTNTAIETQLNNSIKVYRNKAAVEKISELVA